MSPFLASTRRRRARRAPTRRPSRLLALLLSSLFSSLAAAQILPPPPATALPAGGQIIVGSGRIAQSGAQMTVSQGSAALGIDWTSFSIGSAASVNFVQPSASAVALNRIVGNDASQIYGKLSANGQVFLVNTNGVLFAPGSQISVGGMVASALDLSQQNFAAGRYSFSGTSSAAVDNQGSLTAQAGGYLALFGNRVSNEGTMTVSAGSVLLASGSAATISISGSGLLSAVVTPGAQGSVVNSGLIAADGGTVTLSAHSAEAVAASLVNNTGIVRANSMVDHDGQIWITGDQVSTSGSLVADGSGGLPGGRISVLGNMTAGGQAAIAGTLSAQSDSGSGGSIETSAASVTIAPGTQVSTRSASGTSGTWLIDPNDFTIAPSGGDISGTTLGTELGGGNVVIQSSAGATAGSGNIYVNDTVAWSANQLTLAAQNNIYIAQPMNGSGTASLALQYGLGAVAAGNTSGYVIYAPVNLPAGSNFSIQQGSNGTPIVYTVIDSLSALQALDGNTTVLGGSYALGANIDATSTAAMNSGAGFSPIGTTANAPFTGRFDGLGHTVTDLVVNMPSASDVGLFAQASGADIRNLNLAGGSVTGGQYAGALVGNATSATVTNIQSSAAVSVDSTNGNAIYVGGLVGSLGEYYTASQISFSSASGSVFADGASVYAGGLVGYTYTSSIANSQSSGNVTAISNASGTVYAGGLVGQHDDGYYSGVGISSSSASGSVYAAGNVVYAGGLAGYYIGYYYGSEAGDIESSSASGNVTVIASSTSYIGGLVGIFSGTVGISASSASGNVSYSSPTDDYYTYAGGLVGYVSGGAISGSSATGSLTLTTGANGYDYGFAGGLVGLFEGTSISNSSATGAVSGGEYAGGLVGEYDGSGDMSNVSASGNVSGAAYYAGGLVGYQYSSGITNGFASGNVSSTSSSATVGGLVGEAYSYTATGINDSSATGTVSGTYYTGGLVGYFYDSSPSPGIQNSYASGAVSGGNSVGGLVGYFYDGNNSSSSATATALSNSHATGNVSGSYYVGGLVGTYYGYRSIWGSYATGNVSAANSSSPEIYVGGLVGEFTNYATGSGGGIVDSFATGAVSFTGTTSSYYYYDYDAVGGLVGCYCYYYGNASANAVSNSYATGSVSATSNGTALYVGGLVGWASNANITDTYSSGAVGYSNTGTPYYYANQAGGLIGNSSGSTTTASYWNTTTSGQSTSAGGTGLTNAAMMQDGSFTGWNVATSTNTGATWRIYDGYTEPLLESFLTPITINLSNTASVSKVYDGTTSFAGISLSSPNGTVTNPQAIFAAISAADVGTYSVGAAQLYSSQLGYDLTVTGSSSLTITARPLTLSASVFDKVYDGTTNATLASTTQPTGLVAGQSLTLNTAGATAVFSSAAAGPETVTVTGLTLSNGANGLAADYSLPSSLQTTATIAPALLTLGGFSATNRVYDGTTAVTVTESPAAQVTGLVGSDVGATVTLGGLAGTMLDKNVGTAKPVNVTYTSLSGIPDPGNYTIAGINGVTVDISPLALTLNGVTATNRTYNASTAVTVSASAATLSGTIAGDVVDFSRSGITGNAASANASTSAQAVTVAGLTLVGPDAQNYTVQAGPVSVIISPEPLTVYAEPNSSTNKVYDGTTTANVTLYEYYNYDGSNLVVSDTGANFSQKDVGTGLTITVSGISLSGSAAPNYTLANTTATTSGTISPLPLTVTGVSASNKVYDGTTAISVNVANASVTGVLSGDSVTVNTPTSGTVTGNTATATVGNGLAVTVPGFTLSGAQAADYTLTGSTGVTVDITPKPVTATYVGVNKVYDGTAIATVSASTSDFISGDQVNFASNNPYYQEYSYYYGYSAQYTGTGAKNVGTGKSIAFSGNFLTGANAVDYTLTNTSGTATANITPLAVTAVFTGSSRPYDGMTDTTVSLNTASTGIVGGDSVSATDTAVFTSKNAGANGAASTINVSNIVLTGTDAGNYTLNSTTATTSAVISPLAVTISGITATNRTYDGTVNVALSAGTVSSSGFIAGDNVSVSLPSGGITTGTMADPNVGTAKPVTVTGLSLTGTDAANYSILGTSTTVNITPAGLSVSYAQTGGSQVYNGGVIAQVTPTTSGLLGSDTVSLSQSAIFTGLGAKNVGTGKPIAISNIQISACSTNPCDYTLLNTTATTTGTVTALPVTVSYSGVTRTYDGTADTSVQVNGSSTQLIAGDVVGFTQTAVFATDGSAGNAKTVDISDIALTGVDAPNYSLVNTAATTTATILPKPIGVTGITASSRVYDGTDTVAVNVANAAIDTNAIVTGDNVTVTLPANGISTGTVATPTVGNDKPVTVTGLTLSGSSAANYTLSGATGLEVDITPLSISATYSAASKVYDGTTTALVTGTSSGILTADLADLTIDASGNFSDGKDVGSNKTVAVTGGYLAGPAAVDYTLQNPAGTTTASITPLAITPTYSGGSRVYNGGTAAPVTSTTAGIIAGDVVSFSQTAVFTGPGTSPGSGPGAKDVGSNKPIAITAITLGGADAMDYSLTTTSASATGSVTPKPITIEGLTGVSAESRVYDGTTTVVVDISSNGTITPTSSDIVAGDNVTINVPAAGQTTGTLASKNVGNNLPVLVNGLSLSGTDAEDYTIAAAAGITVNITPLAITAAYTGVNMVYNGSANATVVGSSTGILAGDNVTIGASGTFTAGKNVGTNLAVTFSGAGLGGSDAEDYTLTNTSGSTTANISPLAITAVATGGTRVYDGTTTAPVTLGAGFISGDNVSLTDTAVFTGPGTSGLGGAKDVGTAKPVLVSNIALTGTDAGDYMLTSTTAATTGNVTPRPITIVGLSGITAVNRVYDGTTTVQVNVDLTGPGTPEPGDIIAGDNVTVNVPQNGITTGTMADKNVGTAKPVTVTGLSLSGSDAMDYSIVGSQGVTVNITPLALTATYAGVNKVYDGTTSASVLASSTGIIAGDSLTIGANGVFTAGKDVGNDLAVAVSGGSLSGTDAGNYTLSNPTGSTTANITPLAITASVTGGTKVYDGTTTAPVTVTPNGVIAGDQVTVSDSAVFTGSGAKDVGNDKPVAVSGITLGGAQAFDYTLAMTSAATTADVTPRPITIDGLTGVTAQSRVYNGSTSVVVDFEASGTPTPAPGDIITGDSVSVNLPANGQTTGTMADKNVGTAKPVAVTGLTLSGADAMDYVITATQGVTVDITPLAITASYTGVNKVYDGTASATVVGSSSAIIAGDNVTIGASGTFAAGKNVGNNLTVSFSGATLGGTDAEDYTLTNPSGSTTANITPLAITASAVGGTMVYNGTTTAPVTVSAAGIIAGDNVSLSDSAVFTGNGAKDVGQNKPVQVSDITLSGSDAGNYVLSDPTTATTASVTPLPVTVNGLSGVTATNKVYDGTTTVQVTVGSAGTGTLTSSQFLAGDDVSIMGAIGGQTTGTVASKNVGNDLPVFVNGLSLTGAQAMDYTIAAIAGVTVDILPLTINLTGVTAINRIYDGTTVVALNTGGAGLGSGVIAGDSVSLVTTGLGGSMADKNVGTGKTVTLAGATLSGSDAGNYNLVDGTTTVTISPLTLVTSATASNKVYDATTTAQVALSSNAIAGDSLSLADTQAAFSDPNAGTGKTVTVSGISMSGADAGNYLLAATTATTTATITPAPLTIAADNASKVYGSTLTLAGDPSTFSASGLVGGQTVGQVALASAGTVATASVAGNPYAITASNASGGSFNPANYNISYVPGALTVTPLPITIAVNSGVVYDNSTTVPNLGTSLNLSSLPNGDQLVSVQLPSVPYSSAGSVSGTVFELTPSNAVISTSSPLNYAITYESGLLFVLPAPSTTPAAGGSTTTQFSIQLDPALVAAANDSLATQETLSSDELRHPRAAPPGVLPALVATGGVCSTGSNSASADLRRRPLIALDDTLCKLIQGSK